MLLRKFKKRRANNDILLQATSKFASLGLKMIDASKLVHLLRVQQLDALAPPEQELLEKLIAQCQAKNIDYREVFPAYN